MLHKYEPTIEASDTKSPNWYKSYHNSFYLCQLVNNLLLSYMKSFIEFNEFDNIVSSQKEKLIDEGILTVSKSFGQEVNCLDEEKVYSIAIESFLEELSENFKKTSSNIKNTLYCMGINTGSYFDKNVKINLKELSDSLVIQDWFSIVKGFLNVWEFMFLFSIVESALKEVIGKDFTFTSKMIEDLDKKYPNVLNLMNDVHNVTHCLSKDSWALYTTLRNIYSHTHGIISFKNKKRITREIQSFRKSYNDSFHNPKSPSDMILSSIMVESNELFNLSRFSEEKFYLIDDKELNIFRNFSSKLLYILSKELSR